MRIPLLCAIALALSSAGHSAQKVVIYRCTDASGALTVQNAVPCPKGSKQERRVIEAAPAVATPPVFVPRARPAQQPTANAPVITPVIEASVPAVDTPRLPPPALFECRTYDKGRYLSDDGNPPQRCAPLTTMGIDGGSGTGAGESCEMVSDQCQRVADEALCENWKARLLEAQSALLFGRRDNQATAQAEIDRIAQVVRDSTCGA
jgi:hypothetical protein